MSYRHTHEIDGAIVASELIVPTVLQQLPPIQSVLDVGGGAGAWAAAFKRAGVAKVLVQDDASAAKHALVAANEFESVDFRQKFPTPRRVDLAVCLEVAEHLPASRSEELVDYLSNCSDRLFFSAAVPGQGGVGHINCQAHDYWLDKFKSLGYSVFDSIRPLIATNTSIPYWYRQNLFLLSRNAGERPSVAALFASDMDLIHKGVLKQLENPSVSRSLSLLKQAVLSAIRRRVGSR